MSSRTKLDAKSVKAISNKKDTGRIKLSGLVEKSKRLKKKVNTTTSVGEKASSVSSSTILFYQFFMSDILFIFLFKVDWKGYVIPSKNSNAPPMKQEPINEPIDEPIDKPINEAIDEAIDLTMDELMNETPFDPSEALKNRKPAFMRLGEMQNSKKNRTPKRRHQNESEVWRDASGEYTVQRKKKKLFQHNRPQEPSTPRASVQPSFYSGPIQEVNFSEMAAIQETETVDYANNLKTIRQRAMVEREFMIPLKPNFYTERDPTSHQNEIDENDVEKYLEGLRQKCDEN